MSGQVWSTASNNEILPDEDKEFKLKLEMLLEALCLEEYSKNIDRLQYNRSGMFINRSGSPTSEFYTQDIKDRLVQMLASDIKEKSTFYKVCKSSANPSTRNNITVIYVYSRIADWWPKAQLLFGMQQGIRISIACSIKDQE